MVIDMKKTQKGVTLVEVIVAIAVFSMISLALFSSVIGIKNVTVRQEQYVRLEMVCYDIDAYYKKYNDEWHIHYFEKEMNDGVGYLTTNFIPTNNLSDATYKILFSDDRIISISTLDNKTTFVENIPLPIDKELFYEK